MAGHTRQIERAVRLRAEAAKAQARFEVVLHDLLAVEAAANGARPAVSNVLPDGRKPGTGAESIDEKA